jgi:acetyltransferase
MTARNLEFLFRPNSVAVIAEPDEPSRYAEVVWRHLTTAGFSGPLMSASARPRRFSIGARMRIDKLDSAPDLAIICASLDRVPQIISELGARGTRAVIIGPSVREKMTSSQATTSFKAILNAARPQLIRILGPGSGGLIVPTLQLNASVAPVIATPGKIALVAQSASVASAVLDRACSKGIGFSSVLHLGASIDIDLADVLDWLAADPNTESILVQFDSVLSGRKFMSAARAAARNKPVVAIRGGRSAHQASGPFSTDDLYEAALRRAGWVIIDTLGDLFEATEAMARVRPMRGQRLCILANGHGLGRMASDALLRSGGQLATLTKDTVQHLGELLQTHAKPCNPIALPANITPQNWAAALTTLLKDGGSDAVLTVCSPSPFAPSPEVAAALCPVIEASARNVFTCWVGGSAMLEAQQIAAAHGVLSHDSPEKAIAVFLGIVSYLRNRQLLIQMPPSLAEDFSPDDASARGILQEAIGTGAETLTANASRHLLQAYGIDSAEHPLAASIDAAIEAADAIGYPVDLYLNLANSPEFDQSVSGLRSSADIHIAARGLRRSARVLHPGLRVTGYRLRPSAPRSGVPALRLGVVEDPLFGPVIFLGPSATARCCGCPVVVALPPLNLALANDLVARSGFAREAPDDQRAALEAAASTALVRLSQLLTDLDEVVGIDLDPLHIETTGILALDSRIHIEKRGRKLGHRRFAICPYPKELEQHLDWNGRALSIRPIRPEDETALGDLLNALAPEDARMRFFNTMRNLPRSQLARFTQIDYDREMALVAIERCSDGVERSLGEVRVVADPDSVFADFAIVVRSDLKGQGLGRLLLQSIIDYARSRGIGELRGETLSGNARMQQLAKDLGFQLKTGIESGSVDLCLTLREPPVPLR